MFIVKKRKLRRDLITHYNSVTGGCRQVGGRLFSSGTLTGHEDTVLSYTRGSLSWILGNILHKKSDWALE